MFANRISDVMHRNTLGPVTCGPEWWTFSWDDARLLRLGGALGIAPLSSSEESMSPEYCDPLGTRKGLPLGR